MKTNFLKDIILMISIAGVAGLTACNNKPDNATIQEVKDFGKRMETEHQRAYDDLATLAASKGIAIPGTPLEETMKDHEKRTDQKGYDYDRKVCDYMVDSHDKAIRKFEKVAEDSQSADIRSWAATMLPDLRAHHEAAKMLKGRAKDLK